jgi:hypothetical protein
VDQRELKREGNGNIPDGFTIVLVMHLRDPDAIMDESRAFVSVVTDWFKIRVASAERVYLIALSDPLHHQAISDWFIGVHSLDVVLRPIFEKIGFTLALHNHQGEKLSEYILGPGEFTQGGPLEQLVKQASSATNGIATSGEIRQSKSWWKIW